MFFTGLRRFFNKPPVGHGYNSAHMQAHATRGETRAVDRVQESSYTRDIILSDPVLEPFVLSVHATG